MMSKRIKYIEPYGGFRALDVPLRRTERAWRFARAWLHDELSREER